MSRDVSLVMHARRTSEIGRRMQAAVDRSSKEFKVDSYEHR
jgi:hypothetical protein